MSAEAELNEELEEVEKTVAKSHPSTDSKLVEEIYWNLPDQCEPVAGGVEYYLDFVNDYHEDDKQAFIDYLDAARGNVKYAMLLVDRSDVGGMHEGCSPYTLADEDLRAGEIIEFDGKYILPSDFYDVRKEARKVFDEYNGAFDGKDKLMAPFKGFPAGTYQTGVALMFDKAFKSNEDIDRRGISYVGCLVDKVFGEKHWFPQGEIVEYNPTIDGINHVAVEAVKDEPHKLIVTSRNDREGVYRICKKLLDFDNLDYLNAFGYNPYSPNTVEEYFEKKGARYAVADIGEGQGKVLWESEPIEDWKTAVNLFGAVSGLDRRPEAAALAAKHCAMGKGSDEQPVVVKKIL